MSGYRIVDQDPVAGGALVIDGASEPLEPLAWISGRLQPDDGTALELHVRMRGRLPDIDTHLVPLASERLRAALERERIDNVQYRRAALGVPVSDGFWLMNVLGLVEAVDRERSDAAPYLDGPGLALGRFTIDAQRADGARLFRLAEAPHLLIADAELAARLNAAGLLGLRLRATEDYDGY